MKKKVLAVLLTAAMTLSVIACGSTEKSETTDAKTTEASGMKIPIWMLSAKLKWTKICSLWN